MHVGTYVNIKIKWKKKNSQAKLDKGHRTMTNKTKATQKYKKMSNTDSIKKHRCTHILQKESKLLFHNLQI
jgi:hypothetical protein